MSKVSKKPLGPGSVTVLIIAGLFELGIVLWYFIFDKNIALFDPRGWIAQQQHDLLTLTLIVLLAGATPVILILYFVAWKYRESNTSAVHKPETRNSKRFLVTMWIYPIIFFVGFSGLLIPATHKLEPRKTIDSDTKTLKVQVVSLRWKWLFLYPEQGVASVNYLKLPKDTPATFYLTADEAPMSSFWIPNLGGQLYAMTSHVNKLNLLPTEIGEYPGRSAEITGAGFAGMTFTASVSEADGFEQWVRDAKRAGSSLDMDHYKTLAAPSENVKPTMYANYDKNLYATVLMKYAHGMHEHASTESDHTHEGGH